MARHTESVCKLCRRQGEKLFLKGERCMTSKCAFERRPYAPGMHGPQARWRRRPSDYSVQLREKQKARRIYGVMERQFRRYFKQAQQSGNRPVARSLGRRLRKLAHWVPEDTPELSDFRHLQQRFVTSCSN